MTKVHVCKQWSILVADNGDYTIVNLAPDGTRQFYCIINGQYGEPLLIPEPDLAFAVPAGVHYVNAKGDPMIPREKISGIICKAAGRVVHRFSLSNAKRQGINIACNDGKMVINGTEYHLYALVIKDAKRVKNYDAFFTADGAPTTVKVLELEDLV